jgi:diacylglycerol kinase (ATP)
MKRIWRAFRHSFRGLTTVWKSETSFRQEIILCIALFPVIFLLPVDYLAKSLMVFSLILILIMELINSAIETIIDRISAEKHPLSKKAKDIGSSLVLLAFANAIIIWIIILFQMY